MSKKIFKKIVIPIILLTLILSPCFFLRVNPFDVLKYFAAQVGSTIGVSVSVPPNPFNQVAKQLKEKEISLLEKERTLEQKEAELGEKNISEGKNRFLFLILGGGILLVLILVVLNFCLDYRKRI